MDSVDRITGDGEAVLGAESARTFQRDSLFMVAKLHFADAPGPIEVRIRNLSSGGLMLEYDRVLPVGTALTLEMRGLGKVTGTVAWCTRGRVGVALDTPIDPKSARQPVGNGPSTPDYAKPLLHAPRVRRSL